MAGYFTGNNYRRRSHSRFGSGNHHTFDDRLSAVNRHPPAGQGSWFYPAGHAATQSFEHGGISAAGRPFFGIVFGSGVIISCANDGTLTKRDLILVLVFLGICHSIIEDTLIFAALGAHWWVLISCRFVLAALATFAVSFVLPSRPDALSS